MIVPVGEGEKGTNGNERREKAHRRRGEVVEASPPDLEDSEEDERDDLIEPNE